MTTARIDVSPEKAVWFDSVSACVLVRDLEESEAREQIAVGLLELLGDSATLEEFTERALALVRRWTGLETMLLEVPSPGTGRILRAGVEAVAEVERHRVAVVQRGRQLGAFLVDRREATGRPGAIDLLGRIAPLLAQGLLRFAIEEQLGVSQEAERALAAIRGVALADSPFVFDEILDVLGGVSFLGPGNGLFLVVEGDRPGHERQHFDRHCPRCPGHPESGARMPCGRGKLELPVHSSRGEELGRLVVCDGSDRSRCWQELEFLQAVADTLGTAIERRRAAEAIAEAEARYRRIVEYCPEGLWVVDRTGLVLFANASLEHMLGVRAGCLVGSSVWSFVSAEDRAEAEEHLAAIFDQGTARFEVRLRDLEGRVLHAWISGVTIPEDDGRPLTFLGLITDL